MREWIFGFVMMLLAIPAWAGELRSAALTREMISELERRCTLHAKNEQKTAVLLTGRLFQSQFTGESIPSCRPQNNKRCRSYDWFPETFRGILTTTNHYPPDQKVVFTSEGLTRDELQSLSFVVGQPYALCAEPRGLDRGLPHFVISFFDGLYHLTRP